MKHSPERGIVQSIFRLAARRRELRADRKT
jgi:hypothetical protein